MLMTRESDYAVRIMRALSCGRLLTVKVICEQEAIPTQFAYKILKKLSNANLIRIVRGAAGGYELIKDLAEISLLDLMVAVGEEGVVNACIKPGYECTWRGQDGRPCRVHAELARVQKALDKELSRHSLQDILYGDPSEECAP